VHGDHTRLCRDALSAEATSRHKIAAIWAAIVTSVACAASTPSAPTPGPSPGEQTVIAPVLTGLSLSETVTFALVIQVGEQQHPATGVRWTTTDSDVCSIASDGRATARKLGVVTLIGSDGQRSASLALQVVQDLSGHWRGQSVLSATRVSGSGPYNTVTDQLGPYELRIQQVHDRISGGEWLTNFRIPLSGTVDSRGRLSLTGTIDDPDFGHEEIAPWMAEVGNDGHLRGSALITSRYANIFGPQVVQYREEMIDIVRQ